MAEPTRGAGRLLLALTVFLVLGTPFAAVAWEQLSEVLSGRVSGGGVLLMLGTLSVLLGISFVLRRFVSGLEVSNARPELPGKPPFESGQGLGKGGSLDR